MLVGSPSIGSFSSRFTELVGSSPSQYQHAAHLVAPPPIPGCYVLMWAQPLGRAKTAQTEKPPRPPAG